MQLFYCCSIENSTASFSKEESGHCIRVLRMRKGDHVSFTDGLGNLYEGTIADDDSHCMKVVVLKTRREFGERSYRFHMAVSPLKNADRFEWFIEKAVEMGIDEITPLICSRTEKTHIKKERIENLILSAMKQSVKTYLPVLNEPLPFKDFLAANNRVTRIIAHCYEEIPRKPISEVIPTGTDLLIMIGPEGDFTTEEVKSAIESGFISAHLGTSRLRTETAGIVACCSVYTANISS